MSCTFRPTTLGEFTDTQWPRGLIGTSIPESGLAARTSRSETATESAGGEVLGGAGGIGGSTGITITQLTATTGTTPGAIRFTTETITIDKEASVALLPSCVAEYFAAAVLFTTARAEPSSPSTEIPGLLEDMRNPAVRAASAPAPSAATTMADRKGAFRHAEAAVSVAEEGFTAVEAEGLVGVVADIGNRSFVMFLVDREI